jgi:hypothetical protein
MTNPTSNFGWQMPTSTDLVTDLPADFEVFGQAVDTSLADLKGGTTGQVLSKASNTNMDFTWVTTDDANAIQNSIVDAKGDLVAASANDTPARLAVGNNGETLVADSSTSTGLRYQGSMAAGKNAIINGNFDVWQRGTSSSSLGAYTTADRWYLTAISGSGTFAQETTVKPNNSNYSLKFTASATSQPLIYQVIETANAVQFAGQTVVLSGKFASSASVTFSLSLEYSTSTDVGIGGSWTSISPSSTSAASPTSTTFVNGSAVFAVPSTARSLRVGILPTATIANGVVLYWSQTQLELGSVQTAFSRAGGTIQGELAACQRYYYRWSAGSIFSQAALTSARGGTFTDGILSAPVTMRTTPTSIDFASLSMSAYAGSSTAAVTAMALNQPGPATLGFTTTTAASFGTAGAVLQLYANSTTAAFLAFSAEL